MHLLRDPGMMAAMSKAEDQTGSAMQAEQVAKDCPSCGVEILAKALKCRYCGAWMPDAIAPLPARTAEPAAEPAAVLLDDEASYSNAQPVRHLVLLSVLTFGLYEFFWFYRNWRDVQERTGMDLKAGWRTAGLIVPFLNIYLVYQQLRLIDDVVEDSGVETTFTPATLTAIFFLTAAIANVTAIWVISLLTVIPLIPVQESLNRFWAIEQPESSQRDELNPAEFAVAMVGAFMTAMAVAGTLALQ